MIIRGLLVFVPISLILAYWIHPPQLWIFIAGTLAIIPLADGVRRATDSLANRAGPSIGGLVSISFGSIAELTLALFVLATGDTAIVKAQITGSLIGTSLLCLGLAVLAGGWKREKQSFRQERAGLLGSLLILSVIALLLPAFFNYTERHRLHANLAALDEKLSLSVSVILILVYIANLVYTLVTHRDIFASRKSNEPPAWSLWKSLGVLLGATVLIAVESDLVSRNLQATAAQMGVTSLFLGVIVLAMIGNASDLISAIYFARQDRMGLVMGICVGSAVQVALLLAPVLVLVSYLMGNPMNLVFTNPLELIAIAGAALAVNAIASDGETTWFEGVLLIAVYCLFALAFFFATP
ncbi:MAG: calcium/proton exchanger [Acidobacteriaceae bacterium]